MSDESFNWIDDELRRVPLPEGLLARLRRLGKEITEISDQELDEALTYVPLPSHLDQRLLSIVEDEQLDEQLREIEVPAGLLEAIAYVPEDERLRDVVVPVDLMLELRRIPPRRRRRIPTARLALAASLLLLITMGYALSMAGLVLTAYDQIPEPYALITVEPARVELVADVNYDEAIAWEPIKREPSVSPAITPILYDPLQPKVDTRAVADALRDEVPDGYELDEDLTPFAFEILGQPYTADDRTPDLEVLFRPKQRGIDAPIAVGFDRQFLITERTNPIVPLGQIEPGELIRNRLPLWTETGSYDRLRREFLQHGLPSSRQIHVEDFLAAMNFQYAAAPPGELAIRAAAGPSVFGEQQAQLLQIGVQAGLPKSYGGASSHVTLALDISDSMRWNARLDTVRSAVQEYARLLRAVDRISLVVFNEDAYTVLEDVSGSDSHLLVAAIEGLTAEGGTNALAGLQLAASLATSPAAFDCQRRDLVVISDGMPRLPPVSVIGIRQLLVSLAQQGTTIHVVAMDEAVDEHDGLRELATMAGEQATTCQDTDALRRFLCEKLLAVSPIVARDASLTIEFNYEAVESYRLLGHESTSAGGSLTSDVNSTLLAGQSGTAVYEVWLKPNAPELVATAFVGWRDENGERQSTSQQIHRKQFRTSWAAMALSLQAAAIAAEAAEVLRQSPFCSVRNRDLRDVLERAGEVNTRLAQRDSFQRFINVLEQAELARRGLELSQ